MNEEETKAREEEPVCPVCGGPLSLNWRDGKPVNYCPDHGDQNAPADLPAVAGKVRRDVGLVNERIRK